MNRCALYLLIVYFLMWLMPFFSKQTQGLIVGFTGLIVVAMMLTSKPKCEEESEDTEEENENE